jgi:hypothetical protein
MPERRKGRGCGKGCLRCWQNQQKHGARKKQSKRTTDYTVIGERVGRKGKKSQWERQIQTSKAMRKLTGPVLTAEILAELAARKDARKAPLSPRPKSAAL